MKVAVETVQKGEATASNVLKSQSEWPLHNVVLDLKYSATLLSITWLSWWRTAAPWGWLNKAKLSSLFLFFSRRDSGLEMWPVITFFRPAPLGHSVVFALLVDLSRVSAAPFSCSYTLLEERRNQTDRAGDSWTLKYLYISFFFFPWNHFTLSDGGSAPPLSRCVTHEKLCPASQSLEQNLTPDQAVQEAELFCC